MAKISLSNSLKYLLFFGLGVLIFYFVYRGQDPAQIWSGIKEFKIEWILLSFVFSLISHMARALRWRMLIQPLGYNPSVINTFFAILVMYLANLAFPRLGEVSRCGVLTKYEKVPFAPQIGTVVTERIVDLLVLLLLLLGVVMFQFDLISGFFENNRTRIGFDSPLIYSWKFWVALIVFIVLFGLIIYYSRQKISSHPLTVKIKDLLKKFSTGLFSIRKVKNPGLFIFYTLLIYSCYFLMTYSILLGYGPTRDLGAYAAFSLLAMGSIGMVIPVQGGIGTYHFFIIQTLLVYGLSTADGQLVALVLHGSTFVFMIFIGLIALLALPIINRKSLR